MQHYFFGGDKDGLECGSLCREFLLTAEDNNESVARLNDMNDPEFAIPFKEIRWIHTIYYPEDRTKQPKHYYVREDLLRKLETIL